MAVTMQGIQSPPGTLPVSPRKADSTAAHSRVIPPVTALEKRGASAGVNSSTANTSASAVYRRGMFGRIMPFPPRRCSLSGWQEKPYAWGG